MYHYAGLRQRQLLGNNPVKYVDPTGEWFGFADVFTGPIDEIVVIAGLTLYGAFLIYNSETNKNFTDAFAESFNSNLEKIKIILSKKKDKFIVRRRGFH